MDDKDFQQKLADLIEQIGQLPAGQRANLEKLAAETKDRHSRMKKTVADLQDSLDYLRLSIKYLVFDLEATRRENACLRKLLDQRAQHEHGEHEGPENSND
ncbi:MAG: transcriptional regulator [Phycisphaerae bacterium]|nr:transcriptional regulator [Phycisphaerae bacterium]